MEAGMDARGRHAIRISPDALPGAAPHQVRTQAMIQDLDRQVSAGGASIVVHPAEVMVGLRTARWLSRPGDEVALELVVTDVDGRVRAPASPPEVRVDGPDGVDAPPCEPAPARLDRDDEESADGWRCDLLFPEAGHYRIRAEVRDDAGRASATWHTVIVLPARPFSAARPSPAPLDEVELDVLDEPVEPGGVARIRVRSPFDGGTGLAVHDHHGIRGEFPLSLEGNEEVLEVPVGMAPGRHSVSVQLSTGSRGNSASGAVTFQVDDAEARLHVEVRSPESTLSPGDSTRIGVRVTDARGEPVEGAEVAFWLVDEAILAMGDAASRWTLTETFLEGTGHIHRSRHASLFAQTSWPVVSPGPGALSGIILDGTTARPVFTTIYGVQEGENDTREGEPLAAHTVRPQQDGSFVLPGVRPGPLHLYAIRGVTPSRWASSRSRTRGSTRAPSSSPAVLALPPPSAERGQKI